MFGMTMRIEKDGSGIELRPFKKENLPIVAAGFSSMKVHKWTTQTFSQPLQNEEEWFDKMRKSENDCVWAIVPDGSETPVGITGIHRMDLNGACGTGIVIWDPDWWGKGVATRAHLGRTLYAANYLNRILIYSSVREPNKASLKALLRAGYTVWGIEPRSVYRNGAWGDTYRLVWINPERVSLIYPRGLPGMFAEGVKRAGEALETARKVVTFP